MIRQAFAKRIRTMHRWITAFGRLGLCAVCLAYQTPAAAGYIYLEPKMLGLAFMPPGIVHFESVQEANSAYLAYVNAANAHLPCPPKYTNPGPSPYLQSQIFDVNGIRSNWGAQFTAAGQDSNGQCYEGYTAWGSNAYLSPQCPVGIQVSYTWLSETQVWATCPIYYPDDEPCETCKAGNPVIVSHGEKYQVEPDYAGPTGLEFTRTYRGRHGRFTINVESRQLFNLGGREPLDGCYSDIYMHPQQTGAVPREYCFRYIGTGQQQYRLRDPDGRDLVFNGDPTSPSGKSYYRDSVAQVNDAQGGTSWHATREDNSIEVYDNKGWLIKRVMHDGRTYTATNLGDGAKSWSDQFGRSLRWERSASGRMNRMVDPAGAIFTYEHDANLNLARVTYPGDHSRQYHYESTYWTGNNNARPIYQLTGITDELGHRYATYVYGQSNRVSAERHHLGNGSDVNQFTFGYWPHVVTDSLGAQRTYTFSTIQSYRYVLTGIAQPAGSGSSTASSTLSYDQQANLESRTDASGRRTCYANDQARNLPTVRVEGLSASGACSTHTAANAVLPTGSRKTTTQWHPNWRLETKVAEPGRIVTTVYNGQPDPFDGNAIATCAPGAAPLPGDRPIAVVCKRVEQATTDTNGAAGFGAALQVGTAIRVSRWTYNQYGQVLTASDSLNNTTTYAYYTDTAFTGTDPHAVGHTLGDLQTITNAKGQVTQFTQYDKHGNVLQSIDPNGVVTQSSYDLRQRLLSTTTANLTTSYEYDAAGQLKRITLPDSSWIGYDYDGAHRQTAVYDHRGNRIEYVLDNAGNRTGENTKDPSGALKRQLARSIDALGRVPQATGRE